MAKKKMYYESTKGNSASVFPSEDRVKNVGNIPAANSMYGDDTMNWTDKRVKEDLKYKKNNK